MGGNSKRTVPEIKLDEQKGYTKENATAESCPQLQGNKGGGIFNVVTKFTYLAGLFFFADESVSVSALTFKEEMFTAGNSESTGTEAGHKSEGK